MRGASGGVKLWLPSVAAAMACACVSLPLLLLLTSTGVGAAATSHNDPRNKAPGVCQSMDIRNSPDHLNKLRNCTVIEGQLRIVLMERATAKQFDNLSFPELREITGFLVFYRVRGLRSLGDLFPNLAVIRGHQLFKDFALVVYDMESLTNLGLRHLTNIERGAVRIERNDRLCYVDTIDWARIAPQGLNNIIRSNYDPRLCSLCPSGDNGGGSSSPSKSPCFDPTTNRALCWDETHCQKLCPKRCGSNACTPNGTCCNPNCLGGCDGPLSEHCHVCRNFTLEQSSGRNCITKCPDKTYKYYNRRCVTEYECRNMAPPLTEEIANSVNAETSVSSSNRSYKILNGTCVFKCPVGYEEVGRFVQNGEKQPPTCKPCPPEGCTRYCTSGKIESLESAQQFRGCTHIKGSLDISVRGGGYVMKELEECLGEVREIEGTLKVTRSFALVTLGFFRSLKRIGGQGQPVGTKTFFVLENPNLEELWDWSKHGDIEITEGKLFIHLNPKLCYSQILPLKNMTRDPISVFDESEVSKDNNGDKAACSRLSLQLSVPQLQKTHVLLSWNQYCIEDPRKLLGYSIYFTQAPHNITQYERRDACQDSWLVDDMSIDEIQNNSTTPPLFIGNCSTLQPLFHPLTRLSPFTRYAAYVKTYTTLVDSQGAQSPIIYFTTLPGQPSTPMFTPVEHVDAHSVILRWMKPILPNGNLTVYQVLITWDEYHKEQIYQLNYCFNPSVLSYLRKDELQKKKTEKELPGQVIDQNCKCEPQTKGGSIFTADREAEQLEAIDFENELQNQVYVKTTPRKVTSDRMRRSIDSLSTAMLNNYTKPEIYETAINETKDGYIKTYAVKLNANVTELKVEKLRHFSWYTVSLWACRAKDPQENDLEAKESNCSEKATKTFRTQDLPDADIITSIRAELLPANKSLPEVNITWEEPKFPNGLIVAYNILHTRVENEGNKETKPVQTGTCLPYDGYVNNGHAHLLKSLAPGNYSITVNAVTLAGVANSSRNIYIFIPERGAEGSREWIWGVVAGCLCALAFVAAGVWYARQGLQNPTTNKLIASVNPEYMPNIYVPDEWEVPRGNIELVRELGQGSFGMVYEGIARNTVKDIPEAKCAVKTVNEHATDRERSEFLNEASVMKAFDTWHVVRLLGVVSRGQPTLVIMELMENGDLKSYLRSHRPDPDGSHPGALGQTDTSHQPPSLQQIQQMAIEIADGMAYLSNKKFVHRDLAARNCMVASDLTVKIGDFGMTRDIYETDYYRKGSKGLLPVRWMSPESLKDGVFSSNSDVWSFGVVLWEMATLAMQPYQGLSNEQVLRYVVEGGVMERPEHCPDRLYELMRACWAHRPSARPTFLQLVASLAQSAAPHFRQRSFFHTAHGQELYSQQQQRHDEDSEAAEVDVGAVETGSGSNLFGVSGRLASWVRELSLARSRTSNDAAAEPLAPSPPDTRTILLKNTSSAGPNGILSHDRERYTREPAATSGC